MLPLEPLLLWLLPLLFEPLPLEPPLESLFEPVLPFEPLLLLEPLLLEPPEPLPLLELPEPLPLLDPPSSPPLTRPGAMRCSSFSNSRFRCFI